MRRILPAAISAVAWLAASQAWASGFLLYEHNAAAQGMSDARTAMADDPSAVFFNPAAITELPGVQLQLGVMGILPLTHYEAAGRPDEPRTYFGVGPDGNVEELPVNDGENSVDAKQRGYFPPYGYATWRIMDQGVTVGIGLTSPFGLGIYWPGEWDGRFIVTESDLVTVMTNPVLAVDLAGLLGFKEHLKLSLAVGYQFVYGQARMSQRIDLRIAELLSGGAIVDPWGEMTLTGDGYAHGYNLALYAELPGLVAAGLSFRSPMTLGISGTARFRFNPAGEKARELIEGLDATFPEGGRTNGRVDLALPMHVNAGVAYLGVEGLKVGLDLYYAFWESYDELAIEFDCVGASEAPCTALELDPIPANWKNAFEVAVGAEYMLYDFLPLRLGYGHITQAVPEDTYDPSLPDGPRNQFCIGTGYHAGWWKLDVAYMFVFWKGVKHNDVGDCDEGCLNPNGKANGTYTSTVHMLGLTFTARL